MKAKIEKLIKYWEMNLSSVNPNMKELEEVISVMEEIISNLKDLKHLSQEQ